MGASAHEWVPKRDPSRLRSQSQGRLYVFSLHSVPRRVAPTNSFVGVAAEEPNPPIPHGQTSLSVPPRILLVRLNTYASTGETPVILMGRMPMLLWSYERTLNQPRPTRRPGPPEKVFSWGGVTFDVAPFTILSEGP